MPNSGAFQYVQVSQGEGASKENQGQAHYREAWRVLHEERQTKGRKCFKKKEMPFLSNAASKITSNCSMVII